MKKLEDMNLNELIRYKSELERARTNYDDDTLESAEGSDKVLPDAGRVMPPVEIIRELTQVKELIRRFKRKDLTEDERKKLVKRYMGFECHGCKEMFRKDQKISVDGHDYCRDCAREAL